MLNAIIRFALLQRLLVMAVALIVTGYGAWQGMHAQIDVFPDLNRPRVVVMTEAHGLAPEDVETLVTIPIETAMNGANGVQVVRSSSGVGISVVYVEFDWGTDINTDRQIVSERLQLVQQRMPEGVTPVLAPISSIMGQILMLGMWSEDKETDVLELRTIADWVVRQRLLTIQGVSQVFTMGGGRKQFQVLVDPDEMLRYGVTLRQVRKAVQDSNQNATGGYLDEQGPSELLVRALGRVQSVEDLQTVVVTIRDGRPVALGQIAEIVEAAQVKRGDSAAFSRDRAGRFSGGPAVVLTLNKQPGSDTSRVTEECLAAISDLRKTLPGGVRIEPMYMQKSFIDRAIDNVLEALSHGGILVVVILLLFLMNLRTTFVTLTAIPLSVLMTAIVFAFFNLSINTMTLGGLAVAIGELVDDAIVDVENIFRRLRENHRSAHPQNPLLVVFQASVEGPQFHCVWHHDRDSGVCSAVCPHGNGWTTVCTTGDRLHRLDSVISPGFAHRDPGAVLLAAGSCKADGTRKGRFHPALAEMGRGESHSFQPAVSGFQSFGHRCVCRTGGTLRREPGAGSAATIQRRFRAIECDPAPRHFTGTVGRDQSSGRSPGSGDRGHHQVRPPDRAGRTG